MSFITLRTRRLVSYFFVFLLSYSCLYSVIVACPIPEVIKFFSCSTQLSLKFILLINVKMPTILGILTFMSRINTTSENFRERKILVFIILVFMSS